MGKLTFTETGIKDLYIIEPTVYGDHRGYFFESYEGLWKNSDIFLGIYKARYMYRAVHMSRSMCMTSTICITGKNYEALTSG